MNPVMILSIDTVSKLAKEACPTSRAHRLSQAKPSDAKGGLFQTGTTTYRICSLPSARKFRDR